MSFYTTGALASGDSYSTVLDGVWVTATFDYEWTNGADSTATALIYASVDQGSHWFSTQGVGNGSGYPYPAGQVGIWGGPVANLLPVNAIKVAATSAAAGNTLTVRFTGK